MQSLDILKRGIGLRAYGQKDPLNEYKKEAFALFENMTVLQNVEYALLHNKDYKGKYTKDQVREIVEKTIKSVEKTTKNNEKCNIKIN